MNFEVVKLIQQFPKEDAPQQGEEKPEDEVGSEGGGALIDYRCCRNAHSVAVSCPFFSFCSLLVDTTIVSAELPQN